MYRRFGDPEDLGGGADGGPLFDEVQGQPCGPLFDVSLHMATTPLTFADTQTCI